MASLSYQGVLARLVVDDWYFAAFSADRRLCVASLPLPDAERAALLALDDRALELFRSVARGSLSQQFAVLFSALYALLEPEPWADLVSRFQTEAIVREHGSFADAEAFALWLARAFPRSRAAELVAYQMRVTRISAPDAQVFPARGLIKRSSVETLHATHPVPALLASTREELWSTTPPLPHAHFVLRLDRSAPDVVVLETNALVSAALELLRAPLQSAELRASLGLDRREFAQLLATLRESELIVGRP